MKTRLRLLIFAIFAGSTILAQTHIAINELDTSWTVQKALGPYVGQTVIFDAPLVVCTNANGNYKVSPWRNFLPESQAFRRSDDSLKYILAEHVSNFCMFNLTNISGYHRCGEKIIGLKAKVNSTSSLTWISGTWSGNTRADLEKGIPDLGDYRLLVCGFNLENYFMTWGSMGAKNAAEHERQRAKISKALKRINADIFGLVELQQGDAAVAEIVKDLNANLPGRNYKYFNDSKTGTLQKVDFVYDANKVEPRSSKPVETNMETQDRKKMIYFIEKATGEKFIYSINHFKAMNTGDEYRRVNEARAVIELYDAYRLSSDQDVLIMGDLNCYAFTEPMKVFMEKGMLNLHRAFHADSSYSYLYGGSTSYIDHAWCNETMFRQVTGMSAYHINSDEDDRYNYQRSDDLTMFRCSDHDPVLVGLKLDSTLSGAPYFNGSSYGQDSLTFYYSYQPGEEEIEPIVYFDIYSVNGFRICPPTLIRYNGIQAEARKKYYTFSDTNPNLPDELKQLLPLPSGIYIIRFYYNGTVLNHKLIVK